MTLAAGGEPEDAVRLARAAIEVVPAEMLNLRADAQMDLARTLMTCGREEAAHEEMDEAIRSYEEKGNLMAASQARSMLATLR